MDIAINTKASSLDGKLFSAVTLENVGELLKLLNQIDNKQYERLKKIIVKLVINGQTVVSSVFTHSEHSGFGRIWGALNGISWD